MNISSEIQSEKIQLSDTIVEEAMKIVMMMMIIPIRISSSKDTWMNPFSSQAPLQLGLT